MRLDEILTDAGVLTEIGTRLARLRIARNWTQAELAERAGIGRATVQRMEEGQSVQMTSFVKVARVLDLLGGLDATLPERVVLPIADVDRSRPERRRARRGDGRARPAGRPGPWTWGDQPPSGEE